ncbi:disease resistance protein RPV1-like [Rosa rugosa]|uniref:disease resistance protein RPV1-like n=1 Tax=Rosa rugosa TaxID=74645 RepID=UPI002B40E224|nr:disease resistance protein RPV1-like [Rosa rugosa]
MASQTNEAASSSTDQNHYTYQIFLSFRGEDTRSNFTDHLHSLLCDRGIETFIDDELKRGEEISSALVKAIEESRISIIVFSQNYASSRWCLDELVKILECRKSKGQEVRAVFYKVDPSDVRHQSGAFGDAFATLDQSKYEDSMGKWKVALKEAADLSGWPFKDGEPEAKFIRKIVGELSARVVNPSCELHVTEHPIGLESCRQDVNRLLHAEENIVRMVGIWGPGGIGKTTIAKDVFNSIHHKFECSCFLADVRSNALGQLQETLLFDILGDSTLKVHNADKGVYLIKTRMRNKKVFLILDDVSHCSQLQNLVPSPDCFGPGSRILITTRDKRWLIAHQVDEVYEVKMLNDRQALNLFSLNAFKRNRPPDDYLQLAQRAVHYAQGLPLALMVLGSHLFRRSREEWEATLDSCRGEDPHREIRDVLKISYDALEVDLKGYFLDIACFFKGEHVDHVKPILEACYDLKSVTGIAQLLEKALIRIDGDRIWMHDLIEEMGKDIVYQESPGEPGKRSRVWSEEDINHILTNNTGTKKVIGIQILFRVLWREDDVSYILTNNTGTYKGIQVLQASSAISLNAKSFSKMKNLRYISMGKDLRFEFFSGDIDYLSNQLRWLDWPNSPLQSFPSNFLANKLVKLNISDSCGITRLWEGRKNFSSLTSMDLRGCKSLIDLPNFTGIPNLIELKLYDCESLVEVHHSVGFLDKLVTLSLKGCCNLVTLPTEFSLKSLLAMDLSDCKSLIDLPNFTGIPNLIELKLDGCESLVEVHHSVGFLNKLVILSLKGCCNLVQLPTEFSLKSLLAMDLSDSTRLEEFTKIVGKMDSFGVLILSFTRVKELHPSIGNLIGLNQLCLVDCKNLTTLPCSIYELQNLEILDVSGCSKFDTFPEIKRKMNSLKKLYLRGSGITELHPSIGNLIRLLELDLADSENLTTIPCSIYELQNLEILNVSRCSNLVKFPTKASISHDHDSGSLALPQLRVLKIKGCNLSTVDFIGSLDCLKTLTELDLSSNNFVSVPAPSKFVNLPRIDLYCCKRLREIPELSANILEVNAWDCESLERFSILPKSLNMIEMNLWNCHRFSYSLGYDKEKMKNILLNNPNNSPFTLVLPGSEVPKWFHISKEVAAYEKGLALTCAVSFEIPSKLNWENIGLALCSVLVEETFSIFIDDRVVIFINEELIDQRSNRHSPMPIGHMRLNYIPLCDEIKGKVDQNGWLRYHCRVQFYPVDRMKSCGVHLVCQPPNEYSNKIVMAAPPADESGMLDCLSWLSSPSIEDDCESLDTDVGLGIRRWLS